MNLLKIVAIGKLLIGAEQMTSSGSDFQEQFGKSGHRSNSIPATAIRKAMKNKKFCFSSDFQNLLAGKSL